MRLLNTKTRELHEFFDTEAPLYAILSHRWGVGEVSFQDLRDGRGPAMQGYEKIEACCRQALGDGFEYAVSRNFPSVGRCNVTSETNKASVD